MLPRTLRSFKASTSSSRSWRTLSIQSLPKSVKPARFGQPTFETHPHLLKTDEVTPGIKKQEYRERRRRLMSSLEDDNAVVVCLAGNVKYASGDIFYRFRQASDFLYLTGFQEPESALVLEKNPSSAEGYRSTVFLRPKDPYQELWDGPRTGINAAQDMTGVDQIVDISEFPAYLKSAVESSTEVYASDPQREIPLPKKQRKRSWSNVFGRPGVQGITYDSIMSELASRRPKTVLPLAPKVQALRVIKSEAEQRLMKAAGDISGTAFAKTMRFTQPGRSEATLAAHFEYLCALQGSERPAYVPVVASGPNALMIHYTANDQIMEDGEMLLMDAGCELHGYASDITRTWPVSGQFSEPQKDLYQAVLNTLKACTSLCTEASDISLYDMHRKSCESLLQELKQIGFSSSIGLAAIDRLYPHFVGHHIGIDLHESGDARTKKLTDGMVVTVEPGIYVPPDSAFPSHFHNMGIRLEDDVVVKKDNFVRLTANAPLEIVDVEGACQGLLGIGPY